MELNAKHVHAAMALTIAASETIRESGRVPSGVLYAGLMTKGVDFQTYQKLVGVMVGAGLVRKEGDELVWIGPAIAAKGGRS